MAPPHRHPKRTHTFAAWLIPLLLLAFAATPPHSSGQDSPWVRPGKAGDPLIWGRRDGLVFGLASPGGIKGPRGLIRIGVYAPGAPGMAQAGSNLAGSNQAGSNQAGLNQAGSPPDQPQLINFIAIEPVAAGPGRRMDRMAFSELEASQLDPGRQGKRMWVHAESPAGDPVPRGTLETIRTGKASVERLSVRIDVERFTGNGAHVYIVASIDSDHPGELRLTPHAEPDSPPLEELTTTAIMGNFERLRLLWLNGRTIYSKELFAGFEGKGFVETPGYPLPDMLRNEDGDALVFCTSDEASPAESPANATAHWVYPLPKYTQYWRVRGADVQPDLRVHVNGRRVYWASNEPLPGGVAFENFEVRQRYADGQTFIFGLTRAEPWDAYQGSQTLRAAPQWLRNAPEAASGIAPGTGSGTGSGSGSGAGSGTGSGAGAGTGSSPAQVPHP